MGIGTLKSFDPKLHELLTESVDVGVWWQIIHVIVAFMRAEAMGQIHAKYDFILERDLEGVEQEKDKTVDLDQVENLISDGLKNGSIEFNGMSDFVFQSEDGRLFVMLCNDGDVHFASADLALALNVAGVIKKLGVKIYDDGKLI